MQTYQTTQIAKIEAQLYTTLTRFPDSSPVDILLDAMEYSLKAGGKRIRPILLLEFCKMLGGDEESAMSSACAIEMIHTFSLIHDDLPEMDNDDFRRGKPSCHKAFTPAIALQAGDALSIHAIECIVNDTHLNDNQRIRLISLLTEATGYAGMIGGQVMDMTYETQENVTIDDLCKMYTAKTAALMRAACQMGAIVAKASPDKIQLAGEYGNAIGLAFQIIDDILDVTSTTDVLGKPVGSDIAENKTTFVTLIGIDAAREKAITYTNKAKQILDQLPHNAFLYNLTEEMLLRKK